MTDKLKDATPEILRTIQDGIAALRQEFQKESTLTGRKLGALAETVNSIRVEEHKQGEQLSALPGHMQAIAIAVDEHTHRLSSVEDRLITIEQKLRGH